MMAVLGGRKPDEAQLRFSIVLRGRSAQRRTSDLPSELPPPDALRRIEHVALLRAAPD
jgi:hypothetical protein